MSQRELTKWSREQAVRNRSERSQCVCAWWGGWPGTGESPRKSEEIRRKVQPAEPEDTSCLQHQ